MNPTEKSTALTLAEAAQLPPASVVTLAQKCDDLTEQVAALQHQIEWFKRQIFGKKSEKLKQIQSAQQLSLGELALELSPEPTTPETPVASKRSGSQAKRQTAAEPLPFFDESKVPMQVVVLPNLDVAGLSEDEYTQIGEKISYRLAQRAASYVVIKYIRPLIKRHDKQTISCPPAPQGVIEGSRADVSFIAGLLMDKFAWHLPLHRQHQRLALAGFTLSRPWLTQLTQQAAQLLAPIYAAQLASIRASRVKAMDETAIKAGYTGHGTMKAAYFWPVYGELDEVCFPYCPNRNHKNVEDILGLSHAEGAVLLSDGYAAYSAFAQKMNITSAQCWAHTRRKFFEAQTAEPTLAVQALAMISELYGIEQQIRDEKLKGERKRELRVTKSREIVDRFFAWVDTRLHDSGLLPSSPFSRALAYARERKNGLMVYLSDPDVAIDTNHVERTLRVIPLGRKNWLFSSTEVGAEHVGMVQSLIVTCRLHDIDPYTYLVDVLQRVGQHPASRVAELTPRLWKEHFASAPLRSDLD